MCEPLGRSPGASSTLRALPCPKECERCLGPAILLPIRPGEAPRKGTGVAKGFLEANKGCEETSAEVICQRFTVLLKLEAHCV